MGEAAREKSGVRRPVGGWTEGWALVAPVFRESQGHVARVLARGDVNTVKTPAAAADPKADGRPDRPNAGPKGDKA